MIGPVAPWLSSEVEYPDSDGTPMGETPQHREDTLQAPEYFLFDPLDECLAPTLQGFRLHRGQYRPIRRVKGRLPSKVLGLHLEADDWELRLYDPKTEKWLPTPAEDRAALAEERQALAEERQARLQAEGELKRLRKEMEKLRRKGSKESGAE